MDKMEQKEPESKNTFPAQLNAPAPITILKFDLKQESESVSSPVISPRGDDSPRALRYQTFDDDQIPQTGQKIQKKLKKTHIQSKGSNSVLNTNIKPTKSPKKSKRIRVQHVIKKSSLNTQDTIQNIDDTKVHPHCCCGILAHECWQFMLSCCSRG